MDARGGAVAAGWYGARFGADGDVGVALVAGVFVLVISVSALVSSIFALVSCVFVLVPCVSALVP